MNVDIKELKALRTQLDPVMLERADAAADQVVAAKERGGRVAVVTGSGPNLHEGVTTLIAELMRLGVVDAVTTSSAVVSHEMGGTLDKVKRFPGHLVGIEASLLPRSGEFELTLMDDETLEQIVRYMPVDLELIERMRKVEGKTIIKAAGNLGYPVGLWLEHLSREINELAHSCGASFEEVAGLGADERTMIGMGARKGLPVLVTVPQLIGGGCVGLHIGDSISICERATRLARMLDNADVIIESAVALTQEVHDGPLERYTGHGLWSAWQGHYSFSLGGKKLIRIDLDPTLETVCKVEREGKAVQAAITDGLPKTKFFKVPFRMEMSGFARHEGSMAVIGDIGMVWPIMASRIAERLGLPLEFISYPQQTPLGKAMREAIVSEVKPLNRERMLAELLRRNSSPLQADARPTATDEIKLTV